MFSVLLELDVSSISGLAALDERRRLGLPDGSHLAISGERIEVGVSEGFARFFHGHFTNNYRVCVKVPLHILVPGDLRIRPDVKNVAEWDAIGETRRQELAMLTMLFRHGPSK